MTLTAGGGAAVLEDAITSGGSSSAATVQSLETYAGRRGMVLQFRIKTALGTGSVDNANEIGLFSSESSGTSYFFSFVAGSFLVQQFDNDNQGTKLQVSSGTWFANDIFTIVMDGTSRPTFLQNGSVLTPLSNTPKAITTAGTYQFKYNFKNSALTADNIRFYLAGAGPSGPSGPSGPAGPAGVSNVSGVSGPSGVSGVSGPSGVSGVSGPAGPAGSGGSSVTKINISYGYATGTITNMIGGTMTPSNFGTIAYDNSGGTSNNGYITITGINTNYPSLNRAPDNVKIILKKAAPASGGADTFGFYTTSRTDTLIPLKSFAAPYLSVGYNESNSGTLIIGRLASGTNGSLAALLTGDTNASNPSPHVFITLYYFT